MKTTKSWLLFFSLSPALFFGTAFAQTAKPKALTVIAITDFHGALLPAQLKTATGQIVEQGGAALLSAYVQTIRAQSANPVILVDGGDLFQGTLESNLAKGAPVIKFYNYLRVAAAAVGNHEFDYGPGGENSVPMEPGDDPQGALKARAAEAHFPFLAANILDDSGASPSWLRPSFVYEVGGLRVGVIGAATPDTPNTTVRANLKGLHFEAPLEYVKREAKALREVSKVDAVILTFHGGAYCTDNTNTKQDDLGTCRDSEVLQLVKELPSGLVDVVVAGHTHQGIAKRIGSTVILQAYSHGEDVGWAEVPIAAGNGGSRAEKPTVSGLVSVCGSVVHTDHGVSCLPKAVAASKGPVLPAHFLGTEIKPDAAVNQLLSPDIERVRVLKKTPLGINARTPITRSYNGESALGNLTADLLRLSIEGSDAGVTNGGGLRADFQVGPLLYGHLFEAFPFDNRVATLKVNGAVLRKIVENGYAGAHGGLSWSNLVFSADQCAVTSIQVNGHELNAEGNYLVVTNDYLAQGGSGFDKVGINPADVHVYWQNSYIMRDVMVRELRERGKDLDATDYYDPAAPRQRVTRACK